MARIDRERYQVMRVYEVACKDCNEDIGRAVTGQYVTTAEERDELIAAHEEVFHPRDGS